MPDGCSNRKIPTNARNTILSHAEASVHLGGGSVKGKIEGDHQTDHGGLALPVIIKSALRRIVSDH